MSEQRTMSAADMARTSNEWMRRYIEEPEKFSREFETVRDFVTDETAGREPSYGDVCSVYQFKLLDELNAAPVP
ncbi:hypothetical protein ACVWZK_006435 [Bradyrhizobium sp. GM0.4]